MCLVHLASGFGVVSFPPFASRSCSWSSMVEQWARGRAEGAPGSRACLSDSFASMIHVFLTDL